MLGCTPHADWFGSGKLDGEVNRPSHYDAGIALNDERFALVRVGPLATSENILVGGLVPGDYAEHLVLVAVGRSEDHGPAAESRVVVTVEKEQLLGLKRRDNGLLH